MDDSPQQDGTLGRALGVVASVAIIAALARINVEIPGTPVPQSGQTLGVVVVGAVMGARWGGLALLAYLAAGALGLPVFADGSSGAGTLLGPTAGYLWGFVLAAVLVGWTTDRPGPLRAGTLWISMVAAHVLILGLGWLRLTTDMPASTAFAQGVQPFLVGGIAKSAAGALVVWLATTLRSRPSA